MDEQAQKINKLQEIRKTHPKAGTRWTEDEDKTLLDLYDLHKTEGSDGFEVFLEALSEKFERRPNGIRGRLAKYFPDIPGWDYEGQKKRDEERKANRSVPIHGRSQDDADKSARYTKEKYSFPKFNFADNPEAQTALNIIENTSENLFLTGEAGTGKSSLLQNFRHAAQKNIVVLAPTGVAALNVQGQTIHSFCAFGPDITLKKVKKLNPSSGKFKLLQKLNTVVIDEISMVRADLLDCVDKFLQLNGPAANLPFGGLQMIFIGDLYQLPPVDKDFPLRQGFGGQVGAGNTLIKEYASPYFFDSRAFKSSRFNFVELKTMYRQKERVFLEVLNAVRNNAATTEHLKIINSRVHGQADHFSFEKFSIYLTPINKRASAVNNYFLEKIQAPLKIYTGSVHGNFRDRELPTDLDLQVKIGAQIMMLNNDQRKRWVNGTMGKIVGIEKPENESQEEYREYTADESYPAYEFETDDEDRGKSADVIVVELETGETVYVEPYTWEMFQFTLDKYTQSVDSKTVGTYTQYPFKLAWAVTIHKAQGKTFDKVYIDLSTGTFAHGQLYVALSRCRTLSGLTLKRPICPQDIILDNRIVTFLNNYEKE